jgi:hypothetical protein
LGGFLNGLFFRCWFVMMNVIILWWMSGEWWMVLWFFLMQGPALSLQSIDHIHSCDSLPLGMFGGCNGISDNIFQEHLQHTASFLEDQAMLPW